MAEMVDSSHEQVNEKNQKQKKNSKVFWLLLVCLVGAGLSLGYWWLFMRNRVSTDNAYVLADSAAVSSRVAGSISGIAVENDDRVEAGALLVQLDPRDFQAEVDKQSAALARILAEIEMAEVNISLTDSLTSAQLAAAEAGVLAAQDRERELRHRIEELERNRVAAEAEFNHDRKDFERYSNLYKEGAGSEQQRDRTSTAFKKSRAQYEATAAQIAAGKSSLAGALQEIGRARAQLEEAGANRLQIEVEKKNLAVLRAKLAETQAQLETAELNLSYCTITAPIPGYVAQKRIQIGERVQPGQPLLAVIPLKDIYVEANFKETQLQDVRIGQPVEIKADIYPGRTYEGKVAGIRAGTGAAFSLLPPENATGNWIKVVQRIPVKIFLDAPPSDQFPLRVGGSLEVSILTADKSGPTLRVATSLDGSSGHKLQ